MKNIVLASQSPRRKELLEKTGCSFIIDAAYIDETIDQSKPLTEEIKRLSHCKAEHVLHRHPDSLIIGSDTIVTVDGIVLGKPADKIEAMNMLRRLSGRTHQVITGLCILSSRKEYLYVSVSDVSFAVLTEDEIEKYVSTGEPMDKAGAYAIQGIASRYITGINGDYYAIMGLPLCAVYEELKNISEY
ncbi:MAG: septum formation protein Maf [Lachnospiraceae bacterium]|nr:septum formation protein Maf [Lachnospiraceae bacterium]